MYRNHALIMEETLKAFRDLESVEAIGSSALVSGSGDAFAAAMTVEEASDGRFRAVDPHLMMRLESSLPVIVVSASGKTIESINVARRFHDRNKVIGITGDENSEVARFSDHVIKIPVEPIKMSGGLSFLEMLDALFRLANLDVTFESPPLGINLGHPCFVATYPNFGIAQFLSLKMAEIFGISSEYFRINQFFHAPVFSMRNREIVYLSDHIRDELTENADDLFKKVVVSGSKNPLANAVWGIKSMIETMIETDRKIPYFLEDTQILDLSSSTIYGQKKR